MNRRRYLTRRERDIAVMLATCFGASFMAGLLSYETASGFVIYDYRTALGLFTLAGFAYLGYRAVRRAGRLGIALYRGGQA
jgi:hypothetical protein